MTKPAETGGWNAEHAGGRRVRTPLPRTERPWLMAHRGSRRTCPENTLAAFRRALEDGAHIIETDLQVTSDGRFVCLHDATVDRTTNGTGTVASMTLAEIRSLHAGGERIVPSEERVPTLDEAAAVIPVGRVLALELKSERFLEPGISRALVAELDRMGMRDRSILISFHMDRLRAVRQEAPDIPTGWITLTCPWPPRGVELLGPYWPLILVNPLYVWIAHRRGQVVCPLDETPNARLRLYRRLGCDAILTDDPAETRSSLQSLRSSGDH